MIHFYEEKKAAVIFGNGTVEVLLGNNDQMDNAPYIRLNGWSEPQPIKEYDPKDVATGEATGEAILLQFSSLESFEVFEKAVLRIREMMSGTEG